MLRIFAVVLGLWTVVSAPAEASCRELRAAIEAYEDQIDAVTGGSEPHAIVAALHRAVIYSQHGDTTNVELMNEMLDKRLPQVRAIKAPVSMSSFHAALVRVYDVVANASRAIHEEGEDLGGGLVESYRSLSEYYVAYLDLHDRHACENGDAAAVRDEFLPAIEKIVATLED